MRQVLRIPDNEDRESDNGDRKGSKYEVAAYEIEEMMSLSDDTDDSEETRPLSRGTNEFDSTIVSVVVIDLGLREPGTIIIPRETTIDLGRPLSSWV